jgi:hypothetical protein
MKKLFCNLQVFITNERLDRKKLYTDEKNV